MLWIIIDSCVVCIVLILSVLGACFAFCGINCTGMGCCIFQIKGENETKKEGDHGQSVDERSIEYGDHPT